jgi:hypothetical protein
MPLTERRSALNKLRRPEERKVGIASHLIENYRSKKMTPHGELVITDENGSEKFRGETFEKSGLAENKMNRHARRLADRLERRLVKELEKA